MEQAIEQGGNRRRVAQQLASNHRRADSMSGALTQVHSGA